MSSGKLSGKTALVTGASRGIGRAICTSFAGAGANVIINYCGNSDAANETLRMCEELGTKAITIQGDVADMAQCEAMFALAREFGTPDILINNAGITMDNLVMRMSEEEFSRVIDVNLKGAFLCTKLASRPMIKKRFGRIVNISSVVGITGNAGQANYAAAKAGLIGMTKSCAREFAARGITVNAVAPGFIETDMTAVLPENIRTDMMSGIPMSKFGSSENIASAVLFLCTEDAAYITGQVLNVDGGMVM